MPLFCSNRLWETKKIKITYTPNPEAWNGYVFSHPCSTLSHLYHWKGIIEKTYHHRTFYLAAVECKRGEHRCGEETVTGILPLVHMDGKWGGNRLVSLPFLDEGGIIANNRETEKALVEEALKLGRKLKACYVEMRQENPLESYSTHFQTAAASDFFIPKPRISTRKHSLRMDLPGTAEDLMKSFRSKLRSQIKKAVKNGFSYEAGGAELLPSFYQVLSRNMKDLGSPVHSKRFFENIMAAFEENATIVVVRTGSKPVAAAIVVKFKNRLKNPWASSLKSYRPLNPNMLLYWAMLEYACNNGLNCFDFGRSSKGAGTYRFKRQWGAEAKPLFWHYLFLDEKAPNPEKENISFNFWKQVPLPLSKLAGPCIRKHISL